MTGTVKIGLTSPLSGAEANLGQDAEHGIQLAIDQLKTSDPGVSYQLVTADDQCAPAGGASAYGNLIDVQQVDVIIGSACSGATLGGMPLLQRGQVPGVTFGATNPQISQQSGVGGNAFSWRMNIDDSIIGATFSKFIASQGVKTIAFLGQNNDFGRGAAAVYQADLPSDGVKFVDTEYFTVGATDLRPQLTKIASLHPDGLLFFAEAADCANLVNQSHELGLTFKIFSRAACTNQEAINAMTNPQWGNGIVEASYWVQTPDQPVIAAFQAKFGTFPPYNAALAYYCMLTIDRAVQAGGASRSGIEAGLAKVNWQSAIGPITFDAHHQAHPNLFLATIKDGKPAVLQVVPTS